MSLIAKSAVSTLMRSEEYCHVSLGCPPRPSDSCLFVDPGEEFSLVMVRHVGPLVSGVHVLEQIFRAAAGRFRRFITAVTGRWCLWGNHQYHRGGEEQSVNSVTISQVCHLLHVILLVASLLLLNSYFLRLV